MYSETFGQKLAQARKNAGYTQKEVEKITRIKRENLSRYETGALEPCIEILGILADFYCVSLDWLVGTAGGNGRIKQ